MEHFSNKETKPERKMSGVNVFCSGTSRWLITGLLDSVALVSKRTKPTERLPLVGEVNANFCRYSVLRVQ
jgi:hypothetical protein